MRWISGLLCVACLAIAVDAAGCSINAPSFSYGAYDPAASSPLDAVGQISVSCLTGTSFKVTLDAGRNSGGSFQPRKLISTGTRTLDYNLYLDAVKTQVWGDGTGGTFIFPGLASGIAESLVVYGRIPARQKVPPGSYDDRVIVTVEW